MVTHLEHSRSLPIALEDAFDRLLPVPLETILGRRYLAVAGVASTEQGGVWGASGVGQQRTIRFSDGGTAHETLTSLDRPTSFGYHLDGFTGLLKPLVSGVEGRWSFASVGTGTRVTWSWDVTPANPVAGLAMPVFERLWQGFARQGFEDIETYLLA